MAEEVVTVARWLVDSLDRLINAIRVDDFVIEGILSELDILYPRKSVVDSLITFAERERKRHRDHGTDSSNGDTDWHAASSTRLYRSKRAQTLAGLLVARDALQKAELTSLRGAKLRKAASEPTVKKAITTIARAVKAEHVGIDMMDITVCGAVAPYNHLLGGKLVCLMLMSPEVVARYNTRYADAESVIASSLKGESVSRTPQLSLLCTTSLYGNNSSQYNRIKLPLDAIVPGRQGQIRYQPLGRSGGYGSFHFSTVTMAAMENFVADQGLGGHVKNIFGEGGSPLLRKLRTALTAAGLPANEFLRHKNERIVYGVPLAKNFRQVLAGREEKARYFLPLANAERQTRKIAAYWRNRWLKMRLNNDDVLRRVEQETLSFPVTHGARVPLYLIESDDGGDLFSD